MEADRNRGTGNYLMCLKERKDVEVNGRDGEIHIHWLRLFSESQYWCLVRKLKYQYRWELVYEKTTTVDYERQVRRDTLIRRHDE